MPEKNATNGRAVNAARQLYQSESESQHFFCMAEI